MSDSEAKYPSELADRFQVRLPPGMRDAIKAAAEHNNRSMNAEIVMALDYWLEMNIPYDVNLGGTPDAQQLGKEDWEDIRQVTEDDFKKEIDRSIELLKDMRRRIRVSAYRPEDDSSEKS